MNVSGDALQPPSAGPKQEDEDLRPEPEAQETHKFGKPATLVGRNSFESEHHFYTKVLNAQIHPLVGHFFLMDNARILSRYCHLYPAINKDVLADLLNYKPTYFSWAGADLFNVTEAMGGRKMVVIETNSCPSGQKSMPLLHEGNEANGYRVLIEKTFKPLVDSRPDLPAGGLAVIYDKNDMEASGYAATMADVFKEEVHLVSFYWGDKKAAVRWNTDKVMEVRTKDGNWIPIRAAFRYVTQKPWERIPLVGSRTFILNPVLACLAGGRNKLLADKAYGFFNARQVEHKSRLEIRVPETIRDVTKLEVPLWVKQLGGHAVVKVPYSNAGQGVHTITSAKELQRFMDMPNDEGYDQYIVQSLIGNYKWSSVTRAGQYFHVGTIPDRNSQIYCADIRMMVHFDHSIGAFRPLALYSRRAHKPLKNELDEGEDSWGMLGTNLSVKVGPNEWTTETNRLFLMDTRDFNKLGLGTDDLIDAFIQTVMATIAIDKLAQQLMKDPSTFNRELFRSLNKDEALMKELFTPPWEEQ